MSRGFLQQLKVTVLLSLAFCGVALADTAEEKLPKGLTEISQATLSQPEVQAFRSNLTDAVTVVEFFSYACHHCQTLEKPLTDWKQTLPESVGFKRVPVIYSKSWLNLAKAYHTTQSFSEKSAQEAYHAALMSAVKAKKLKTVDPDAIMTVFIDAGSKPRDFERHFHSFEVQQLTQRGDQLTKALQVRSVPSLIVFTPNGAYQTNVGEAGGVQSMFRIVEALIAAQNTSSRPADDSESSAL